MNERLSLALGRIYEIPFDENTNIYSFYFNELASYISLSFEIYEIYSTEEINTLDIDTLFDLQENLYINKKDYKNSIYNPEYLAKKFNPEIAKLLAALAVEVDGVFKLLFDNKINDLNSILELFLQIYGLCKDDVKASDIESAIYFYAFDYLDSTVEDRVIDLFTPKYEVFRKIIMNENLNDFRYLFKFGEYVDKNSLATAKYLASLSDEVIDKMAFTLTNGFAKGFNLAKKNLSNKKYVRLISPLGFEKLTKRVVEKFQELGLTAILSRSPYKLVDKKPNRNYGCGAEAYNKQLVYDHEFDSAIFFKKAFTDRKIDELNKAYTKYKDFLNLYAGPVLIETFGEENFEPLTNKYAYSYSDKQKNLQQFHYADLSNLDEEYIKSSETSFSIIAWPTRSIANSDEEYSKIFNSIININTLDSKLYEEIQQKLIDTLDLAEYVYIKGKGKNKTNLKIHLHKLKDPTKETNFENCLSDVNIPLGEVFTSPLLTGTSGLLHISDVFLKNINFKDLEINFKDGMIEEYTCKNFENIDEAKKLIADTLFNGHKSLAIGEFAIGTNTLAYVVGKKFNISKKFPILIAEKTGPHFAIGDTCYSHEEDVLTYNPDGKAIIAKDNEISALRNIDFKKAYFNTHTDITIPYDELDSIYITTYDNKKIYIIENSLFVLDGTTKLNEVF